MKTTTSASGTPSNSRIKRFNRQVGLHQQGSGFYQLSYTAEQCEDLLECLDVMLKNTIERAPRREDGYDLERLTLAGHAREEHKLERAIYGAWRPGGHLGGTAFSTDCDFITFYQVRIQSPGKRSKNAGWGRVDLVGVGNIERVPVLIELKKAGAKDTLLRVVVEIAAYAIALRESWPGLRNEWSAEMTRLELQGCVPEQWQTCRLVCAAPQAFWDRAVGLRSKNGAMPLRAWKPFLQVLKAFARFGLTFEFVSVATETSNKASNKDDLPRILGAKTVPLQEYAELMARW